MHPHAASQGARRRPRGVSERGTSLLEAVIAAALMVTILGGVAHLLVWSRRAVWSAGIRSAGVMVAVQKLEQLRSLAWSVDASGAPVTDAATNLSLEPHTAGGAGLQPSPEEALARDTQGFVDFVDIGGQWRGTGPQPPAGAAFVRRWAIEPFPGDEAHTLLLTVVVLPIGERTIRPEASLDAVRLKTVRTRRAE